MKLNKFNINLLNKRMPNEHLFMQYLGIVHQ